MSNSKARNIVRYVTPTIMSCVCFFLFTIVDGIFVGRGAGTNALGSIGLIAPFTMAVGAVVTLINIGGVTIFAIHIGKGDVDGANKIFRHGLFLLVCAAAVLSFVGVFFADGLSTLLGAGETFHQSAVDYIFWYSVFIFPSNISYALQSYCRNDNAPGLVSITVIASTVCNIFGDWLLIFPFHMGTKGAAIATGVSQSLGLVIILFHFIRKQGILRFGKTQLAGSVFREIFIHGLPEGISQLAMPVMMFCTNRVLVDMVGDIGINAFSIITYVASFTMAIFAGTSEGLQPLFGQSYGAKNEEYLKFYLKAGLGICFFGSLIVSAVCSLFSRPICAMFGADAATLEYILRVMPQFSVGFVAMALNVMISSYLYSTERPILAAVINLLRSIIVSAAIILVLPKVFGVDIIWFTFLIYEGIVFVVAAALLKYSERNGIQFK